MFLSMSTITTRPLLVVNGFTHSLDKLLRDLFHAVLFLSMFSTPLHNLFLRFTTDYKVAVYTNVFTASSLTQCIGYVFVVEIDSPVSNPYTVYVYFSFISKERCFAVTA